MTIENNIYDILIILLIILVISIIIKIIHNKIILYNQNKAYQKIIDKRNKRKELLLKEINEQKKSEQQEEINRIYKNLNINLQEININFVQKIFRFIIKLFSSKDIVHQITNCNQCDRIWCNKKNNNFNMSSNVKDNYIIGVPLKDYSCKKLYDNMDIIQDCNTGHIFVVEKRNLVKSNNVNFPFNIFPFSLFSFLFSVPNINFNDLYLLDDCKQCNINWCKNSVKKDIKNNCKYRINELSLSDLGCNNINKTWKSIKDVDDKVYVYNSIDKTEKQKKIIELINYLEKDITKENELEYKFNINIKNNKKKLLNLLYKKLDNKNVANLDEKIQILHDLIHSKKEQIKLVEQEKYKETIKLEEKIKELDNKLSKL